MFLYVCPICKKEFYKYHDKRSSVRLCSRRCYYAFLGSSLNPASKTWYKKGHQGHNKGKHLSPETKRKLSESHNKKSNPPGEKAPNWQGGKIFRRGYISIYLPTHPGCNKQGYIQEHRVVMEKTIGRYLYKEEQVHHINFIKHDNRPENLKLFGTNSDHIKYHQELARAKKS